MDLQRFGIPKNEMPATASCNTNGLSSRSDSIKTISVYMNDVKVVGLSFLTNSSATLLYGTTSSTVTASY